VPDILAIVSKAVFEKDARVSGKLVAPGDVWPVDRYNSSNKALSSLQSGGRIFLVTVRPPKEELWLLGVLDAPSFDGSAWISKHKNTTPITNITSLRSTIVFESGKGMAQDKGTLGMSLQTPRALAATDVAQIMGLVAKKPLDATLPAQSAPAPRPKRTIGGKYEVMRQLGEGGMGIVYEARHTGTGRLVAVKEIMGETLQKDAQVAERFEREARATATVETQHIALILDSGSDPETKNPFLVMELLRGEDLQQLLRRLGPIPQDVALRIVAQACLGLSKAHAAGVIHRDIKPANLFLARRDAEEIIVKLLDFGIARVREEFAKEENRALTSTGLMLGTPLYMSPEQVQGPKNVDHRTDLWSLGIVLYEMLTGATPYAEAETLGALLVSICAKPARSLAEAAPHVRRSIARIVAKSLALDPAQRYQTADELYADLIAELPTGARLFESMLAWRPDSVRADDPRAAALELAATEAALPVQGPEGTLLSPGARKE
jgi:hypothetical protein